MSLPHPYYLRPAVPEDHPFLYDLVRQTMQVHVEATYGKWDEEWQYNRFTENFVAERWQIVLAESQQELQTIGGVRVEHRPDTLFLANLHLLPFWQGRGIGTVVVRLLQANAVTLGLSTVTLTVIPSNRDARRLYERLGFRIIAESEQRTEMIWCAKSL